MPRVWQIASGDAGRRFTDLFLQHDVMFCGPGRFGPYDKAIYRDVVREGLFSNSKVGQVRRFATDIRPGDVVLLRSGYRVVALGLVDETGYAHVGTFDDVYGWDLQHTHRVIWQQGSMSELDAIQSDRDLFADRKQIPTFTGVNDPTILEPVERLLCECSIRPLKDLPEPPPEPLTMDQLGEALFARGLGYDAVRRVRTALEKQRRLIRWYELSTLSAGRPTEHEVVAHIILPLLQALGWSEQLLAVEWNKIDLAVFWGTPTNREHCKLVCEAKVIGRGLQDVFQQAARYVDQLGLAQCDKILLTDGQRFYLYRRDRGQWAEKPAGYLNVFKIREQHLCPPGTNAVDTLIALTPAHVAR